MGQVQKSAMETRFVGIYLQEMDGGKQVWDSLRNRTVGWSQHEKRVIDAVEDYLEKVRPSRSKK